MALEQIDTVEQLASILYRSRWWHRREQLGAPLHPEIHNLITTYPAPDLAPIIDLCCQWPHVSNTDPTKVAFTENETKGEADRQTTTNFGRYVRKFYSPLIVSDHALRDLATKLKPDIFGFTTDGDEIYRAVTHGPHSCMSDPDKWDSYDNHPYRVYNPELGWRLAVRYGPDNSVQGRCWVCNDRFVRSYKKCPKGGYSHSDEALETWLRGKGIEKVGAWSDVNARIEVIPIKNRWGNPSIVAPYIDGHADRVDEDGYIVDDSEEVDYYRCCNTNGYSEEIQHCNQYECSHCGQMHNEYTYENDGRHVGRHGDNWVGPCCEDEYTLVYGRRGEEYFIQNDDVIHAEDGCCYDPNYLSDNDIVQVTMGKSADLYLCVNDTYVDADDEVWDIEDPECPSDESEDE
jgi:hypothetical protein